jgi:hypothetical protein
MLCAGALAALEEAITSLTAAIEELRRLGKNYQHRVARIVNVINDSLLQLCSMWQECAAKVKAKCTHGKWKPALLCCVKRLFRAFFLRRHHVYKAKYLTYTN